MARSLPEDTRGIIDPAAMMRHVDFARYPAGPVLAGIIDWLWSVAWDLPAGRVFDQQVLNHPSGHISVGTLDDSGVHLDPPRGRVYGVLTRMSHRRLTATGWTVAAKSTVGGLGVLLGRPAREVTGLQLSMAALAGLDGQQLVTGVAGPGSNAERVDALRRGLEDLVATRDEQHLAEARWVAEVAARAEGDRTLCRVDQLAAVAGVSVRTLQRLFDSHVGVAPSFVIRRWRIIQAAEAARAAVDQGSDWRGWAAVAAELGYADQAHLTRDFQRHLGTTPSAYVARNRPGGS